MIAAASRRCDGALQIGARSIGFWVALLALLAFATSALAQKSFTRDDLASDAVRLEATLRAEAAKPENKADAAKPADLLRKEATAALTKGDARAAYRLYGLAVAADPKVAAGWFGHGRAALAIQPANFSERYNLRERAATAAYAAYLRATTKPAEAQTLALLAESYVSRALWRPALDSYRASLAAADVPAVRATYEKLRAERGFRVLDYKVDSDGASPRVCFTFSEPLERGRASFSSFVAVSGDANAAVTAEGSQICVDGLKHGERYAVVLRQGLPSAVNETLLTSVDYEIYVRDRSPQVRFTGRNYVLPRSGQEGIPVVSVNAARIDVEIARVGDRSLLPTVRSEDFMSQLGRSGIDEIAKEKGFQVWKGTLDAKSELNRDVVTAFPILDAVGGRLEPGVYVMTARAAGTGPADPDEDYGVRATQWFVVSDLGIAAQSAADGVGVTVRSLADAKPLADVELKLVARNNEVLATRRTGADGFVRFEPGLSRGAGGLAPGLVVATDTSGDYGFLDLAQSAFDLTDRGVKGRVAPGALDAFVFTERGVYRSGETVFVTALMRSAQGIAQAGLPLTLVVQRPDGIEFRRAAVQDEGLGGRSLSVPLLSGAPSGTWRVRAYADPKAPSIGEASFLVEDYVPERLEVTLAAPGKTLVTGAPATVDVAARYLFGAPGAGLDISGEVAVQAAATSAVPGLEGYEVGLGDEEVQAATAEIEETAQTDAQGRARVVAQVPEVVASRPLEAKVTLRVGEAGGRAVERSVTLPIRPAGPVIGLRKLFSDLSEGDVARFEAVAAKPDGARIAGELQWSLYQIDRRYQWYQSDGRWSFEPVETTRRIADGKAATTASEPARMEAAIGWGRYRLDVTGGGNVQPASTTFQVGYGGTATADTPDRLDVKLDKASYTAGETAKLAVTAPFAGEATVSVISDRVLLRRAVSLREGDTEISLPVDATFGAGAYAVVEAYRPLDAGARRMPGRALGLAWFAVNEAAHRLDVALDVPAQIRPRGSLDIPVTLAGLTPGEEAYVTVAAVDVGILNLTRYEAPNPGRFYFGQRQIGAELRDLYGFLIDGMQGTRGAIRSGGDAAPALSGDAPTQAPLARYSGVVKVGADGKAQVSFDIPPFNGTVRVMAVAWSKDRVGQASADVIVRDPVVVTATLPRFLNVGDRAQLFLDISNVDGPAGDYAVTLDMQGPVAPVSADAKALKRTVKLAAGGKTTVAVPFTATGPGTAAIAARLAGGPVDVAQSLNLRVQPGTAGLVRRTVRPLPAGGSVTLSSDLVADLMPGTTSVAVSVSPLAALDVPALLAALDRYPYGCTEQTISRALPLLYVNRLAEREHLALDGDLDGRVNRAIERILARQDSAGSFGLWQVGGSDLWLNAYAGDFLTRARERGFAVPQRAFDMALDRLRNAVVNAGTFDPGEGEALAYAAYVLARNGRPVMGDLRYLADTRMKDLGSPLARGQIAAALALLGDRTRAQAGFSAAIEALRAAQDARVSRADYGSRLRDAAGLMALASEANIGREAVQRAALVVSDARATTGLTSTQENAWLVMAATALSDEAKAQSLAVDGTAVSGAFYRNWPGQALGKPVTIANKGRNAAEVVVSVAGNPTAPEPALERGYRVERKYYRLDGSEADPAHVRQNERLVTVLTVTEEAARFARLLLVDRLPAGFEIDNPRLVDSGSVSALSWLSQDVEPAATEYRDDRFVVAFDRDASQPAFFTVAYIVRAVTPGRYIHPPALVEDMYRPDRFGRTGYGTVEVGAR